MAKNRRVSSGGLFSQMFTDPGSGEFSASRFCTIIVSVFFLPLNAILVMVGKEPIPWEALEKVLMVVGSVYGVNSAANVLSKVLGKGGES